jgi:2-polyprenyl-3-methyl-5-hydroxy-6-metoxy-1,4-benzoquinol methylase
MAIIVDPEENEVRALQHVGDWRHKRVIEIGCGDGRLTLRLARLGAKVYAIDPDPQLIQTAHNNRPQRFAQNIRYRIGSAEHLDHANETFDLAVFAWAL